MRRLLSITVLLAIIALAGATIFISLGSRGERDNYFNRNWRGDVSRYPFLRTVFSLHNDGDGKDDYVKDKYGRIFIQVDAMEGIEVRNNILGEVASKIGSLTGKEVIFEKINTNVPFKEVTDEGEIEKMVENNKQPRKGEAFLYLLFVNQKLNEEKLVGITFKEYGIIIFADALNTFTENVPRSADSYKISTILHEFGHQLGLPHNDEPGCLMNEKVEMDRTPKPNPADVIVDFCPLERNAIRRSLAESAKAPL